MNHKAHAEIPIYQFISYISVKPINRIVACAHRFAAAREILNEGPLCARILRVILSLAGCKRGPIPAKTPSPTLYFTPSPLEHTPTVVFHFDRSEMNTAFEERVWPFVVLGMWCNVHDLFIIALGLVALLGMVILAQINAESFANIG